MITPTPTNPKWIRDEEILLVDLYLSLGTNVPGPRHPKVIELSRLLAAAPWHSPSSRSSTFRNSSGISLKLQNLKSIDNGRGMRNSAAIDRQILNEFAGRQPQLAELAAAIRVGIGMAKSLAVDATDLEPDVVFTEGRLLTAIHLRRERDPCLRKGLLKERQRMNLCLCDLCEASFEAIDPKHRIAAFEVHHLLPLSATCLLRRTTFTDVALLCAVCHRLIHSAIAAHGRWLNIPDAKAILAHF